MNLKKKCACKSFFIGIIFLFFLTACNQSKFEATYDWPVTDFSAMNQDHEQVSLETLKGNIWIANFVFTNCNTVCPPMTANMAKVQKKMAEENITDVQIVSFSVDPQRDTPEALKQFASKFAADHSNWDFVTGYTTDEIQKIAKSFKTLAEAEPGTDQFIHSTTIYLINEEGIIVKGYNGLQVPFDEIISDLKILTN